MTTSDWIVLCILLCGALFSIGKRKLTTPAAMTGALIGWIVYAGAGFTGLAMMTVFFILGTAATSWQKEKKLNIGEHATHQQIRSVRQVLANAGIAGLAGLLNLLWKGHEPLPEIAMAGSLASAAADTLSSELGMLYGRRFYNILTGKPDQKGLDGVVSIEGTLIGTIAAAIIAGVYMLGQGWNGPVFLIIVFSGTFGNLLDSILGATLERKGRCGNNMVNFGNTLAAAIVAGILYGLTTRSFR
jgi:uncharacterized protein (TIGR00297 family)